MPSRALEPWPFDSSWKHYSFLDYPPADTLCLIIIIMIISSLTQGHPWGIFSSQVLSWDFRPPTPYSKCEMIQGEQTFGMFFSYLGSQFAASDSSVAWILNLMPQLQLAQPLSLFCISSQLFLLDLDTSLAFLPLSEQHYSHQVQQCPQ